MELSPHRTPLLLGKNLHRTKLPGRQLLGTFASTDPSFFSPNTISLEPLLHALSDPPSPSPLRELGKSPSEPRSSARWRPQESPGPSLTPRLLHRTPVQLAVALQRGDVCRAPDLRWRGPTPHPALGAGLLASPAPAAALAPLLGEPHRVKFRAPWPPLRSRLVPGRGKQVDSRGGALGEGGA